MTTATVRIHAQLQLAIASLRDAHQALRDALALSGGDVQLEATTLAMADVMSSVTDDAMVLDPRQLDTGSQVEQHIRLYREQTPVETATATPKTSPYRELQARCKAAGLSAKGKAVELTARLAKHAVATRHAEPATIAMAAQQPTPKATPSDDDSTERAELLAKLATLSTDQLRELVALSTTPTTVAA